MSTEQIKDLAYYQKNADENYITTPISVLRYIVELEAALEEQQEINSRRDRVTNNNNQTNKEIMTNDIVTLTRALTREQMMQVLKENGVKVIGTSEQFDGGENGIWISGENDDYRINYWTENYEEYTFGIANELNELVEQHGWWFEWYDAGTLMCYPQ